jgi:hypothetical protein
VEVLLIRKVSYLRREAVARLWTSDTVWGFVQDFLTLFCMGGIVGCGRENLLWDSDEKVMRV